MRLPAFLLIMVLAGNTMAGLDPGVDLGAKAATNANLSGFTDDMGIAGLFGDATTLILSGCNSAWSGSGLIFHGAQGTYKILGTSYSVSATNITLAAADGTFDRLDKLAVTADGLWTNLTGTASASPIEPSIDESTMIGRQIILIGANQTTPTNITQVVIYAENAEWNTTVSASSIVTNSATNPHAGTKDVNGTAVANTVYVEFDKGSTLDRSSVTLLNLFIRSKAGWTTKTLNATWRNSAGTQLGSAVLIGDNRFGFQSTQTTSYQQIVIPIAAFNLTSTDAAQKLRLTVAGTGGIGFYLDDISVQTGIAVSASQNTFTTVEATTGSITANGPSDRFKIAGGTNIGTRIVGNSVYVDVSTSTPVTITTNTPGNTLTNFIDWSLGSTFTRTLATNTVLAFTNAVSGQQIVVELIDVGATFTVTWPTAVKWPGGTAPTQTTNKTDVVTVIYVGTNYYANSVQNF